MAALLVGLSIMAVMFTVVMPVWKQTAQREKEEELVFRGKQYVHAIGLFQRKFANAYPPNIDVLVDQRFLRKKFKDPITNDDFVPIPAGGGAPGATGSTGSTQPGGQRGTSGSPATGGAGQSAASQPGGGRSAGPSSSTPSPGQTAGGVSGVTSKSKNQSIRLYNGRGHYNEWLFVYVQTQQAAGAGAAGTATPGPRGQRGQPGQSPGPFPGGGTNGGRGRGGGGSGGPFGPGGPNGAGSPFGGGGVTPIQPPSTPRGRL
jgi:type II secretory pathway pseudopilin PulG